jgi:spermidine/putrescine transport system ATP-binding protein
VEKRFGEQVAVRSIDLRIPEGAFFSVIGPSGCGKTTTLRMIAGLEIPDRGRIEVGGRDVTGVPAFKRPVNTVFQSYALFPHLDVFENVAFGLREARRAETEIRARVAEMIELVQLVGRERAKPRQLSGGQQQRVALARALVNHPDVLLLDEPLGALDLKLRKEMQVQLKEVQRRVGITFIYVTHDQEEAFAMSDEVAVMNAGHLEQVGTPEAVYRRPATLFTSDFVGISNRLLGRVAEGDKESYLVDLRRGGRLAASGPPGLSPGRGVSVILRPEELHLTKVDGAALPDGLRAEVQEVTYLGPQRHLRLSSARFGALLATLSGPLPDLQAGAEVELDWSPDSAWLVPEPDDAA